MKQSSYFRPTSQTCQFSFLQLLPTIWLLGQAKGSSKNDRAPCTARTTALQLDKHLLCFKSKTKLHKTPQKLNKALHKQRISACFPCFVFSLWSMPCGSDCPGLTIAACDTCCGKATTLSGDRWDRTAQLLQGFIVDEVASMVRNSRN